LYRTNDQQRIIEQTFDDAGIPNQIASRENGLNRNGLPEIISLLKVIAGQGGYLDMEKAMGLLTPNLGKKALGVFKDWCYQNRFDLQKGLDKAVRFPISGLKAARQEMLGDFYRQLLLYKEHIKGFSIANKLLYLKENTRLTDILSNDAKIKEAFDHLLEIAKHFDMDLRGFFADIALYTDTDEYSKKAEKVSLMTMHAAKGLEFPVVFISGCEEGFIPLKRPNSRQIDVEEERRLFYVAMTRAKDRLYLSRAKKRRIYGKFEDRLLSPFVADIETRLKKDESPRSKRKKKKGSEQHQLQLF
jgi:superfamily I DNA/RNA helicase